MRKRKETTEDVLETTDHNKDIIVDYAPIQFLSFDISAKKIISGNGKKEYRPPHSKSSIIPATLWSLREFWRISACSDMVPNNNNLSFVPYEYP